MSKKTDKLVGDTPFEENEAPTPRSFRWLRRLLYGLILGFFGFFVILFLFIYFYLNPVLKYELVRTVSQSTDSLYILEIEQLNVNLLSASINLKNAHLQTDSIRWQSLLTKQKNNSHLDLNLKVGNLQIEGIHWLKYLQNRDLWIEKIRLQSPYIHLKNQETKFNTKLPKPLPQQIKDFVSSFAKNLTINELEINRASLSLEAQNPQGEMSHQGDSLNVHLYNLKIFPSQVIGLEHFKISGKNYSFHLADEVYQFSSGKLLFSSQDSLAYIQDLKIKPYSILQLNNRQNLEKYQATRLDLATAFCKAEGIDFQRLIYKQELDLRDLKIKDTRFHLQTDRKLRGKIIEPEKQNPLKKWDLKKILKKIPFYLRLQNLEIQNTSFHIQGAQGHHQPLVYHKGDSLNLIFKNLCLGKAIEEDTRLKALFAQKVNFTLQNYEHQTPDGVYQVSFKRVSVSSQDSVVHLEQARLQPLLSPQQFSAQTYYQSILLKAQINHLRAHKFDIERLAYQQEFAMGGLHLYQPDFEAYLDKRKPKKPGQKYQNFEQILQSIPLFVVVDTFSIHRAKIKYTEKDSLANGNGLALHQAEDINVRAFRIQLGQALNGSALAEIDTKNLILNLKKYIYQTPNNLYEMQLNSLEVSSAKSSIILADVSFKTRPEYLLENRNYVYQTPLLNLQIDTLQGKNIDFKRLLLKQEFDWQYLSCQQPKIYVYLDKRKPKRPIPPDSLAAIDLPVDTLALADSLFLPISHEGKVNLRRLLANLPVFIKVDTFRLQNATITYEEQNFTESGNGIASHEVDNINCTIPQIYLGKAQKYNADSTQRIFYSENIDFTLQNYRFRDKNGLYQFTLEGIQSSILDSILLVQRLRLRPTLSKNEFFKKKAYRNVYAELDLHSIRTNTIDLQRLLFEKSLVIKSLSLKQPLLKLSTDKNIPPFPEQIKKTPQEILQALPFYIQIDTFKIEDANIHYTEWQKIDNQQDTLKHSIKNINFSVQDLKLGLDKLKGVSENIVNQVVTARNISLQTGAYRWQSSEGLSSVGFEKLAYFPGDSILRVDSLFYFDLFPANKIAQIRPQQNNWLQTFIPNVALKVKDFSELLEMRKFRLDFLNLYNPQISFAQVKSQGNKKINLNKIFEKFPYFVQIDTFSIQNASLKLTQNPQDTEENSVQIHTLDNLNLILPHFTLDSSRQTKTKKYHFFEDFQISFKNYQTTLPQGIYHLKIGKLSVNSSMRFLKLDNFNIKPFRNFTWNDTLKREVFAWQKGFQKEFFDSLAIKELIFNGLDFNKLLKESSLKASTMQANELSAAIFRDKRFEDDASRLPKMLNEKFQQIKFPLSLDTITIKKTSLFFTQRVAEASEYGDLFFTDIDLEAYRVNNDEKLLDTTFIRVKNSRLMGQGKLILNMQIPLKSPSLYCRYYGSLGEMNAIILNKMLESNLPLRIKSGNIQRIAYNVEINDKKATGTLDAGYKKLRIQFLRGQEQDKKRGFLNFWANLILKNRNNIEKNHHRTGRVDYMRTKDDGFFAVLWRALSSGMLDTLK